MEQMERKLIVNYRWWNDTNSIKENHIESLGELARERIFEMISNNYTSGELHDYIRIDDNDPDDGIEYTGWWELKEEVI
jgi:hypothetical protein